jgi:MFS superfamily sulfate permease-like transporter
VPGTTGDYQDIQRNASYEPVPGVTVLRVESGLFFANADSIRKNVLAHAVDGTKAIIIDGETVPFIDVTAAQMLETLAEDLERDRIELLLARDIGQVRDILKRQEQDHPVAIRTYPTVQDAVTAALEPSTKKPARS